MKLLKKILGFKKEFDFINDRRDAKRYELMLKLNYYDPLTKYSGESITKNISKNGLRFPVDSRMEKGALLEIKIEDPNSSRLLSLKGRVSWLEEFSGEDDSSETARYETGVILLKNGLF